MKCPNCSHQLVAEKINSIEVDVCRNGCGGLWFDRFELKKFDESSEVDLEALLKLSAKSGPVDPDKRYNCPRCEKFIMMRNFASPKMSVKVDVCPNCAGTWLDAGELGRIRQEYPSEAERMKAAEGLFDSIFKQHNKK